MRSAEVTEYLEGVEGKGDIAADAVCLCHRGASLQPEVKGLTISRSAHKQPHEA